VPDVRVPLPWEDPPPTWVSYEEMYKGRLRAFGLFTPDEIDGRWQAFLAVNPSYLLLTQDQPTEDDYRVGTQSPGDPGSGAQGHRPGGEAVAGQAPVQGG